ncbi:MAG: alpha/beta hydrolase [Deltaproteobacteria bacterium]|nr:alpha/beta hydrolase [Deltaproteobacteria bacterium]
MAMTKKIILIAVLVIVVFHVVWYATSRMIMNKKLPDEATVQTVFDNLLKDEKINIDRNSFTETYLEANGIRLHLDVFSSGKNAPTLVFIPGTSVYAKFYIEFMYKMYLQGFNVVGFDLRPPLFMVPLAEFMADLYKSYSIPIFLYLDLSKEKSKSGTDAATLLKSNPIAVKWITFRALGSLMHTELAEPVEKITVPIMLVHAEKDSIFPQAYVEDIYNRLTCKKKYLFFKNTEHLVMTNNVDEAAPPIAKWLKEVM